MLRRVTGYLLIAALLSVNFSTLFIFAGFELNRDYIATHLCINRDKPLLHCNGKCYFMRKIKQEREKEKSQERQSQKNLFQDALFGRKAETKFYTRVLQEFPTPDRHTNLPIVDRPIYQPPQLG
ncbi:MAG TPA: hypothetical protein VFE53_03355 [Mucilaginibacter sp.]|jgi:hypothetical protein|nr:hypothetical protein [Mucilaginibacter sp.]